MLLCAGSIPQHTAPHCTTLQHSISHIPPTVALEPTLLCAASTKDGTDLRLLNKAIRATWVVYIYNRNRLQIIKQGHCMYTLVYTSEEYIHFVYPIYIQLSNVYSIDITQSYTGRNRLQNLKQGHSDHLNCIYICTWLSPFTHVSHTCTCCDTYALYTYVFCSVISHMSLICVCCDTYTYEWFMSHMCQKRPFVPPGLYMSESCHTCSCIRWSHVTPHGKLVGIRRVSNPFTSTDPGSLKIGFLVLIQNAGFVRDNGTH